MGLTRAEESRYPYPHLSSDGRIVGIINDVQVGREELAKMPIEFFGDNKLVKFLPDGAVVQLVGLNHAIDRTEDVFFE